MTQPRNAQPCRQAAPEQLLRGVRLFNEGEYYACHEVLEELWLAEKGDIRKLYQGILQVGVALLHRQRGNLKGALSLLQSGLRHLLPFAPVCQQVDVARLIREAEALHAHLAARGPQSHEDLAEDLVPRVHLV